MTETKKGPRRNALQREHQRLECLDLYLAGMWQSEIAKKLHISQSQVSRDIAAAHEEWAKRTTYNLDEQKAKRLAELDRLERQAQQAWRRSIGTYKTVTKKEGLAAVGGTFEETSTKTEKLVGDAIFLNVVLGIISERCRILGTYAATKQLTATVAPKLLAAAQIDSL
jgi:predicted transcriptional regulator